VSQDGIPEKLRRLLARRFNRGKIFAGLRRVILSTARLLLIISCSFGVLLLLLSAGSLHVSALTTLATQKLRLADLRTFHDLPGLVPTLCDGTARTY
jgi:hypothetical protein